MYDFSSGFNTLNQSINGLGKQLQERRDTEALLQAFDQSSQPQLAAAPALGQPASAPLAPLGSPSEVEQRFVGAVRGAGLTNPVGLGAVAAYGKAESGFSPRNVSRVWNDPSESGGAGQSGGIMSWRNERLDGLKRFAQQRGESPQSPSVETQALYLAQEDPQLIPRLQAAKTPQEANSIMANAWRFAGYNRPGGENARREALTTQYSQAYGAGGSPVMTMPNLPAQERPTPAPAPVQVAQSTAPDPAAADVPAPGASAAQGFAVPGQAAPAPAPAPANRSNVNQQMIRGLLANPGTRDIGKQLWAQTLTGKSYGFQVVGDQLYRTNPSTGTVEPIGITNPKAALDMRKAEIDIKKGERDLEGKGFRTLSGEERAASGVPPEYKGVVQVDRDGQLHFPGKAATEVNVEGNIPAGYQIERDAQGKAVRMAPIPGGPAAEKEATAAEKNRLKKEQTQATGNVVLTALDDIDRLMKEATLPTTGAIGSRVADIKGTAAHDIKNTLETIGANISFDKLAEMRASSPTGGALGAVTEGELSLLRNSLAALQQSSSEGQFKANLGRVRANFERVVHGRRLTDQERKADGPMTGARAKSLRAEAQAAIAGGAPREEVAKRLKEKYGITPEGL